MWLILNRKESSGRSTQCMKTPTALLDSHETAQRNVPVEQTCRFSGLPEGLPLEDFCSQLLCGAAADRNKDGNQQRGGGNPPRRTLTLCVCVCVCACVSRQRLHVCECASANERSERLPGPPLPTRLQCASETSGVREGKPTRSALRQTSGVRES